MNMPKTETKTHAELAAELGLEFEPEPQTGGELFANFLLYGPPKTGKTADACSAPGPVLLLTADTPNATRYAQLKYGDKVKVVRVQGLATLSTAMKAVQSGLFKTVVLDPVNEVYTRLLEDLSRGATRIALPIYGDVQTHLERACRWFCAQPQINFVMVAHELTLENDSGDGTRVEKLPHAGPSKDKLSQKLMGMVDVVAYTGLHRDPENGEVKPVARLFNAGGTRGGDRFDVFNEYEVVDLTRWLEVAASAAAEPQPADTADDTPAEGEKEKVK
jgi:hypothetical protein